MDDFYGLYTYCLLLKFLGEEASKLLRELVLELGHKTHREIEVDILPE
jgi:hypothetical protein